MLWTIPSNAKCSWRMRLHTTPRLLTMSPCLISWVDNFNWISKIVKDLHHHKAVQKFELYKTAFWTKNQPHTRKISVFCLFSIFGPSKEIRRFPFRSLRTKLRLVWLVRLPLRIVETARSCLAARLLFRDPKPRARGEVRRIQSGRPFWEIYTTPEGYVFVTCFGVFLPPENSCEFFSKEIQQGRRIQQNVKTEIPYTYQR